MSAKLIGNADWIVQKGFPKLSGQDGAETVTVEVVATPEGMVNLPSYGDNFFGYDGFFSQFDKLVLRGREVAWMEGKQTYLIKLTFSPEDSLENTDAVVTQEVEYDTQDVDVPIGQHEKYVTNWNHCLCGRNGTLTVPAWWKTAKDLVIAPEEAKNYKWIKPDDDPGAGWYILKGPEKKDVESYRSGICTVMLTQRSTNKGRLARSAEKDYTIQSPPDTFGRPGEWLRGGSKIRKGGRQWELNVNFLNSKKIDKDIYS